MSVKQCIAAAGTEPLGPRHSCPFKARQGSEYCGHHDPDRARKRREARWQAQHERARKAHEEGRVSWGQPFRCPDCRKKLYATVVAGGWASSIAFAGYTIGDALMALHRATNHVAGTAEDFKDKYGRPPDYETERKNSSYV